MTRWKYGATEFTVQISDDGRYSTICRIPRPIKEFLDGPDLIKFIIDGKVVRSGRVNRS